jgi:hypothetical protein
MKYGKAMKGSSTMKRAAEKARAENRNRINGKQPKDKTKK